MGSAVKAQSGAAKRRETFRLKKLHAIEETLKQKKGYLRIAGVDEAGRGPLAGPVVAAACILPGELLLSGVDDSKKLSFDERYALYQSIITHPEILYAVGVVEAFEIDDLNILQATLKAMRQAVGALKEQPDCILIDGSQLPPFDIPVLGITAGDRLCQSIATASIIAKVTRDQIMRGYHELYPQYGFNEHMGYGTEMHRRALKEHGPCPIHRRSFGMLKEEIVWHEA